MEKTVGEAIEAEPEEIDKQSCNDGDTDRDEKRYCGPDQSPNKGRFL